MKHDEREERPAFTERAGGHLIDLGRAILARARGLARAARERLARRWRDPRLRRRVLVVGRDLGAALALALTVLGLGAVCFERVEPGTVGVRQVNWGAEREIGARDLAPGLYFGPRPLYSWHHLDARTRILSFAPASHGGQHPLLELRSASGTTVEVAVSVPYRIRSGEAHAIVQDGLKLAWPMRVKSTVEKVLVQELSRLDAEGFADPARRSAACAAALARLNVELAPHHVVAEHVLVRGFRYAPTYEKKKQEEQLASQTLATNEVLTRLKRQKLENEFLAQRLGQERAALVAEWDRRIAAEELRWKEQVLEDQRIANELLALEWTRRRQELVDRLVRERDEARRAERDEPLAAREAENAALASRLTRQRSDRAAGLERELALARAEADRELERARAENELAAAELAREERALAAELALAAQAERFERQGELRALERDARAASDAVRREADAAYEALVSEGEQAIARARALRDRLEAEALARPGASLVLAREAASSLRLERVSLDANDPRVPTVLDLDALVALLLGAGGEREGQ